MPLIRDRGPDDALVRHAHGRRGRSYSGLRKLGVLLAANLRSPADCAFLHGVRLSYATHSMFIAPLPERARGWHAPAPERR